VTSLPQAEPKAILSFIQAARENLDRIEAAIVPTGLSQPEDELDPGSPLNKDGAFLTPRGIEVCYRLFDMGKTRYAVAEALKISYGAATHRYHAWEKLGGKDRDKRPLK
jgi:DNA-binding NarL/FixJ family response regulator